MFVRRYSNQFDKAIMETLIKNELPLWIALTIGGALLLVVAVGFAITGSMLFIVFAVLSITFLGVRELLSQSARQRKITVEVSQIAHQLGLEYQESASFNVLGWPDSFELTKRACALSRAIDPNSMLGKFASPAIPKARNVITHSVGAANVALFDYEYLENEITYKQAVAAIASPELDTAYFGLFPTDFFNHLVDRFRAIPTVLGQHRLAFDQNSRSTTLATIEQFLEANTTLEVGDGFLLLYRNDKRPLQSCDVRVMMDEALNIYSEVRVNP
jgi:hypothetical protein